MEQDLFKLIGNNSASLTLETLKHIQNKSKPSPSTSASTAKWNLIDIANPARKVQLKVKHWVRSDKPSVSPFSKFNTSSNLYTYSTEEYYHYLRDDDWTKEETDYLFSLLKDYDLRFPVISDRYDFLGSSRSIDDLKSRYYSICQKLILNRPSNSSGEPLDEMSKKQLIQSYHFDKNREIERKKQVKRLMNRSLNQIQEENFLYIETRRFEQSVEKRNQERHELMELIGGLPFEIYNQLKQWPEVDTNNQDESNANETNKSNTLQENNSTKHKTNKSNKTQDQSFEDLSVDPVEQLNPTDATHISRDTSNDAKNCIYRFNHALPYHHPSVTLRSSRIHQPKSAAYATRINSILTELEIPINISTPKPLIMATRENVESYTSLLGSANKLSELKRHVDKVESDLRNLRRRKESLLGPNQKTLESQELDSKPVLIDDQTQTQTETFVNLPDPTQSQPTKKRSVSISSDSLTGDGPRKKARQE
ncbi:uncharacterized protein MELLADRAFT_117485 [Melampsora larici-populina 98AG31]|uniref:SWR1-complex protein 4 n=1 Tax=Melampsora larici-populina (strain 98AG31 / pathotype 3-4-7) TaxID=747676 RepID=F4RXU4_MELLP|nr:uncharacterized protein MELLADRAFT_117485 [Melampsora larici-populina 98AG31]EGG02790.1 hypothetical protein MELLADRAFT_117485 [Melampsora larici-populina 98AG31]